MKRNYFSVLLILFAVISFLMLSSFLPGTLDLGFYSLKKSGLKKYFTELAKKEEAPEAKKTIKKIEEKKEEEVKEEEKKPSIDTSSQRILVFGDSMLEGLGPRLQDYCEENNHEMCAVIWYSSSTHWYGSCDTIKYYIDTFKPSYILLAIGSGDIYINNVLKDRVPHVNHILDQIKGYPYTWVGPPNWREDTGINELIEKSVEEGTFFLSKNLKFDRLKDGVHPTRQSAAMWMDTVASFIMNESAYRIKLNKPQKKATKRPKMYLLSPKPPVLR